MKAQEIQFTLWQEATNHQKIDSSRSSWHKYNKCRAYLFLSFLLDFVTQAVFDISIAGNQLSMKFHIHIFLVCPGPEIELIDFLSDCFSSMLNVIAVIVRFWRAHYFRNTISSGNLNASVIIQLLSDVGSTSGSILERS